MAQDSKNDRPKSSADKTLLVSNLLCGENMQKALSPSVSIHNKSKLDTTVAQCTLQSNCNRDLLA